MNFRFTFSEIQSLCIDVAKKPDLKSIQNLDKYLENVRKKEKDLNEPISVLNDLKEYIAFPLILALKKENFNSKGHEQLLEIILRCLEKVLANSFSVNWNFCRDVFLQLFLHITSSQNPQIVGDVSEEIKISALQNVIYLCKALPSEHWNEFTSETFRAQLGHAIYICLQIAEKEKNHHLKITALNTVVELGLKSHLNQFDVDISQKLGLAFANFLPGIAMATTRIALGGEIQGHKVTVAALRCWEYFVCFVVMRDRFLAAVVEDFDVPRSLASLQKKMFLNGKAKSEAESTAKGNKFTASNSSSEENCCLQLKNVTIDCDWVKTTSNRLSLLTESLLALASHSHWKVRESLVHCCQSLFQHCSRSMSVCVTGCLETLVTLKNDLVSEVCARATNALHILKMSLDPSDDGKLLELLEERVFALVTRLLTIIKTQDDAKVLSSVRQLHGSLEVLGERIRVLAQLPSHLDRILRALLFLFTYDYSDSDLLLEKTMSEDVLEVIAIKTRLGASFRYFRSDSIMACATACCSMIGRHGDLVLIVDQCLDLVGESAFHRNEALLLLYLVIKGAVNKSNETLQITAEEREKVVDAILDVLLSQNMFEVPLNVSQNEKLIRSSSPEEATFSTLVSFHAFKPSISVDVAKRNVILVSNALRLTGSCASFLEKRFDMFLNRVLCSLMEKAGENNVLVSHSALVALEDVATACGHASVSELIEKSVPFFWFTLSQKLKRLPEFPSSPQVLRVALRCQRDEVKAFVEELVEDVLDSLDAFHTESPRPLLMVLLSFVDAVASSGGNDVEQKEPPTDHQPGSNTCNVKRGALRAFIEKIHHCHEEIESELKEGIEEEGKALSAEEGFRKHFEEEKEREVLNEEHKEMGLQEQKNEVPKQIELVVRILERCSYLLFTKDRKTQLVILQIIMHCCHILRGWEDQKLPCFHKIWKPLVLRLKDKDFVVLLKALETCVLMVQESGDFLRKRFLKEVFPSILLFLESQSSASLNKTRKSGYYLTPAFKTQRHVLENIPSLLRGLELEVSESSELLSVIMLYLDDRQPPILNQLAFEALKAMKEFHPDIVWLTIATCQGSFRITPPSPLLNPVVISGVKKEHLSKNVLQLYEELS